MRFQTVLLHPCFLALAVKGGGFHTPLMCTCQPASMGSRRAVTVLFLPFDFSLLRLLFFLLSGFQLQNRCLQGCAGEAEGYGFGLSDIWGFHYVSRRLLNIWKGARCDRRWYDRSRGGVLDMELYRGQTSPSIFAIWNCFIHVIL